MLIKCHETTFLLLKERKAVHIFTLCRLYKIPLTKDIVPLELFGQFKYYVVDLFIGVLILHGMTYRSYKAEETSTYSWSGSVL